MEVLPFRGTDSRGMRMFGGAPVYALSVPTRYVHSPNAMAHGKDISAAIKLLVKFLETCERRKIEF